MATESLLIVVNGTFDAAVAEQLCADLRALPPDQMVTIDFTRARVSSLCTLTAFYEAVRAIRPRALESRGLSQHQLAVLHYCGIDPEALRAEPAREEQSVYA